MHQKPQTFIIAFLLMLTASSATLMADFYVIPVAPKQQNIITVAPTGADFTSPLVAMNSIDDSSEQNPYLILVAAGTYDLSIDKFIMKPYVSVAGAGMAETVIRGIAFSATAAEINTAGFTVAAERSSLHSLTLENYSCIGFGATLYAADVNMSIENVRLRKNCALDPKPDAGYGLAIDRAHVTLRNVDILTTDATEWAYGIRSSDSTLLAEALTISVVSAATYNSFGLHLDHSDLHLDEGNVGVASNGEDYAVNVYAYTSTLDISNLDTSTYGASVLNYGVSLNYGSSLAGRNMGLSTSGTGSRALVKDSRSKATLLESSLQGDSDSIYSLGTDDANSSVLLNSTLIGPVSGSVNHCVACTNGSDALDTDCQLP